MHMLRWRYVYVSACILYVCTLVPSYRFTFPKKLDILCILFQEKSFVYFLSLRTCQRGTDSRSIAWKPRGNTNDNCHFSHYLNFLYYQISFLFLCCSLFQKECLQLAWKHCGIMGVPIKPAFGTFCDLRRMFQWLRTWFLLNLRHKIWPVSLSFVYPPYVSKRGSDNAAAHLTPKFTLEVSYIYKKSSISHKQQRLVNIFV